jgi:hypothetical protein
VKIRKKRSGSHTSGGKKVVVVNPSDEIIAAHVNAKLDKDGTSQKMVADFVPDANNLYDLGVTGTRWKNLWLSANATIAGNIVLGGDATITGDVSAVDVTASGSLFLGALAVDPIAPVEGQIWYNTTDKQYKGYNGTIVIIIG